RATRQQELSADHGRVRFVKMRQNRFDVAVGYWQDRLGLPHAVAVRWQRADGLQGVDRRCRHSVPHVRGWYHLVLDTMLKDPDDERGVAIDVGSEQPIGNKPLLASHELARGELPGLKIRPALAKTPNRPLDVHQLAGRLAALAIVACGPLQEAFTQLYYQDVLGTLRPFIDATRAVLGHDPLILQAGLRGIEFPQVDVVGLASRVLDGANGLTAGLVLAIGRNADRLVRRHALLPSEQGVFRGRAGLTIPPSLDHRIMSLPKVYRFFSIPFLCVLQRLA